MSRRKADLLYSVTCGALQDESSLKELSVDYDGVINYCELRAAHGHDVAVIKDRLPLDVIQKIMFEDGFHVEEWGEGFLLVCWSLDNGELRNERR